MGVAEWVHVKIYRLFLHIPLAKAILSEGLGYGEVAEKQRTKPVVRHDRGTRHRAMIILDISSSKSWCPLGGGVMKISMLATPRFLVSVPLILVAKAGL